MMKLVWLAIGIATVALVVNIAPDLQRYCKISSM